MGRKKKHERTLLIEGALPVFHEHGFQRATTQLLVEALDVNRGSLFAEFRNKESLFEDVLELYGREVVSQLFGPLEANGAGLAEIKGLFKFFAGSAPAASGRGCLMVNAAAEFGGAQTFVQPRIESYFSRLTGAYRNALRNGVHAGRILPEVDVVTEADFLTASTPVGIFLIVRASVDPQISISAAEGALAHIRSLEVLPA